MYYMSLRHIIRDALGDGEPVRQTDEVYEVSDEAMKLGSDIAWFLLGDCNLRLEVNFNDFPEEELWFVRQVLVCLVHLSCAGKCPSQQVVFDYDS